MQRKSILKDTIQLTVVQFFLEWVSLLLNVWLTHRIGAANCRNCRIFSVLNHIYSPIPWFHHS